MFFANTLPRARATPFCHDEICTVLLSRLPTVMDVWRAARDDADLAPPLNVYLTRAADRPLIRPLLDLTDRARSARHVEDLDAAFSSDLGHSGPVRA